jgi:hypothetical protein
MSDEKLMWTPTEADRITVSEMLSGLLPHDHGPVFTEFFINSVSARFFVQKHMVLLFFWVSPTTGWFNGTVAKPIPMDQGEWFLTLEEAIDLTFAAIWPALMDMCSKLAPINLPDSTWWKCKVCGFTTSDIQRSEYHCFEQHPYSPSVIKSANKK